MSLAIRTRWPTSERPTKPCRQAAARRSGRSVVGTRRGTYRVLYRIRDDRHEVVVVRVEHRRHAYRPL